jgi:hypothetical protein
MKAQSEKCGHSSVQHLQERMGQRDGAIDQFGGIFPGVGHGAIFPHHSAFLDQTLRFLQN